jgi:putative DNA-invertase from lambdoid prophage Rac
MNLAALYFLPMEKTLAANRIGVWQRFRTKWAISRVTCNSQVPAGTERLSESLANPVLRNSFPSRVFGQGKNGAPNQPRVVLYARVSSHDQQTLPLQIKTMREYAVRRGWQITFEIKEIGSGALQRPKREELRAAARRRELDAILVWRLDRWGRSLPDLIVTLKELAELNIGFVSLTDARDITTPTGRALAGMLAVFADFEHEILRERVKTGIAQTRAKGTAFGKSKSAAK